MLTVILLDLELMDTMYIWGESGSFSDAANKFNLGCWEVVTCFYTADY